MSTIKLILNLKKTDIVFLVYLAYEDYEWIEKEVVFTNVQGKTNLYNQLPQTSLPSLINYVIYLSRTQEPFDGGRIFRREIPFKFSGYFPHTIFRCLLNKHSHYRIVDQHPGYYQFPEDRIENENKQHMFDLLAISMIWHILQKLRLPLMEMEAYFFDHLYFYEDQILHLGNYGDKQNFLIRYSTNSPPLPHEKKTDSHTLHIPSSGPMLFTFTFEKKTIEFLIFVHKKPKYFLIKRNKCLNNVLIMEPKQFGGEQNKENGLRIIDDEFEYDYVFALEKVPNLDENINEKSKAIMRNTEMLEKFKKRIKKNSTILIKTVEDLNDELILYEVQDRAQPIQLIQLYYTPFVNNRRYCTIRRCGNYRICCKDNPNFYLDLEVTESNDYCHSEIVDPILTITQTSSEDFRLYAQHEDLNATIYMTISPDTGHFSNYNTQNPIMLGKYIEDKLLYIFIQTAYGYKKLVKELNKIRLFKCPIQLNVMDQHGNNLSFQSSPNELEFQLKLNKVATFKIPPNINRISMNGVCSNSIIIGRLFSKHDVSSPLQVIRSPSFSLNLFVQSNKNLLAITSNISNKKNDEYIIELFRKADQNDEKITEKRMIPQNFYVFKDCDISFGSYQVILTRTPKEEDGNSENHTTEKFNSNIVQFENDNGLRRRHLGTVKKNGGILYYSLEFATIQEDEFSW